MLYSKHTDERHAEWLKSVKKRVGHLNNFDIVPYWGFDDLFHKAGTAFTSVPRSKAKPSGANARSISYTTMC